MSLILVPVDFSECAPSLLSEALRFAEAFGGRLLLLHASETPTGLALTSTVQPPGEDVPSTVAALLRRDAEAHLAPLVASAEARGVPTEFRVVFGHPAATILEVATREGVDMIVMGTHGRTGLVRAMMGSVAEEIVRHADVPVVTVRVRHRPACGSRRCATCDLGHSDIERALSAEDAG